MSTNLNYKQVANVKRRSWDVEAYEQKAKERAQAEAAAAAGGPAPLGRHKHPAYSGGATAEEAPKRFKLDDKDDETAKEEFKPAEPGAAGPTGSQRAFLQPRKGKVDIDSKIGATEIISAEAAAKTSLNSDDGVGGVSAKDGVTKSGVGWHCSVCDCFLKDSMTYLDHINGRKHQRKLGFSMRVERSTKDQMLGRLSQLAKEKEKAEKQTPDNLLIEENFEDKVKAKDEEEARQRAEKAKKRQERKKQKQQAPEPKPEETEEGDEEGEEVEEEGINPDLAAMMGFSGFGGGGKK